MLERYFGRNQNMIFIQFQEYLSITNLTMVNIECKKRKPNT